MRRMTRAQKIREHRVQEMIRTRLDASFTRVLVTEFRRVAKAMSLHPRSEALRHHALEDHKLHLRSLLSRHYRSVMDTFGKRTFEDLKRDKKASQDLLLKAREDQFAQGVRAFVDRWTAKRSTEIAGTTWRKVGKIIADAEADPETRGQGEVALGKMILEEMDDQSVTRARTIARTETHSASQDASFTAAQSMGIDLVKEWVATHDSRTREDHIDADGQIVLMHEPFKVGDDELQFPGDPSGLPEEVINCRCICLYHPAEDVELTANASVDSEESSDD
jgi:uncharacterized protein with gpF-like domain